MALHRVGILTGGGDAPGLNAVLRAFIKRAVGQLHWQVVGIEDSFDGMLEQPMRVHELTAPKCRGLLTRGGTFLGTTNRGDPFNYRGQGDIAARVPEAMKELGLEGLVVIGGDGTQAIGWRLMQEHGVKVIGVPKTIDNDLSATDRTFGFQTSVEIATEALDRLHTTAESHDRVILLEVMGRDAGHIALHAGIAGGADCIVIPEIPYDPDRICAKVMRRRSHGRQFTIIIVAEGAVCASGEKPSKRSGLSIGGPSLLLAEQIKARIEAEVRVTVLGHIQRGGTPCAYDRLLSTRYGAAAVDLIEQGRWGEIVVLRNRQIVGVPIPEAIDTYRTVDPSGELVRTARAVGVEFGAP